MRPLRRVTAPALGILAGGVVACLPIGSSVPLSPAVIGTYRGVDGRPRSGEFALANAFGDTTCAAATLHAATDTAGVFRFPPAELRSKWMSLVPSDRRAPEYSLCVLEGGRPREFYRGVEWGKIARDSVTCVAGVPGAAPVRCSGQSPAPRLHPARSS